MTVLKTIVDVYASHGPAVERFVGDEHEFYVGITTDLEERVATHERERAFDEHKHLASFNSAAEAINTERALISYCADWGKKRCRNGGDGGEGVSGQGPFHLYVVRRRKGADLLRKIMDAEKARFNAQFRS